MKTRLVRYLQNNVQTPMLIFLFVALNLLAITAGYLYVLKKPFMAYRQSQQTLALLENELQTGLPFNSLIQSTEQSIAQLDRKLNGSSPAFPVNQLIAFVISQLDTIAKQSQVKLISVNPGAIQNKLFLRELPFVIEISGSYLNLFDWLNNVEKNLGAIVINQFEFSADNTSDTRHMKLTLVSYRFGGK